MKYIFIIISVLSFNRLPAQTCDCNKEFSYIRQTVEQNFAGFEDYVKKTGRKNYQKQVEEFTKVSSSRFASDNCPLLISRYLNLFKSNHLGFRNNFNAAVLDSNYASQRPIRTISEEEIIRLKNSSSWEGIYYFTHDTSYKIAVIKDVTTIHDYIGVLLESKLPHWKKGMMKFEGKLVNDSLLWGVLYMRNHRPKMEGFALSTDHNKISGDWQREGTPKTVLTFPGNNKKLPALEARSLDANTYYLRIGSFDISNKRKLDSMLALHDETISKTPNLVIDLRNNGGGSDRLWQPLIPYMYTKPIRYTGVDVLATEKSIEGWKKYLEFPDLSEDARTNIMAKIARMENNKGKWISMVDDIIDSSITKQAYPEKIVILVNRYCGSSTEEFILTAKQSAKVILAGENTTGNLDYSNVVETSFSCFPYILNYASTRSRRLNNGAGIDNIGIAPDVRLDESKDWIEEAQKLLR